MNQTAVEWLWDELVKRDLIRDVVYSDGFKIGDLRQQAKQMEKQEHSEIFDHAYDHGFAYGLKSNQPVISDEEIEKAARQEATFAPSFIRGIQWYREQLKTLNV